MGAPLPSSSLSLPWAHPLWITLLRARCRILWHEEEGGGWHGGGWGSSKSKRMFIMEAESGQWEPIWLGALCSGASLPCQELGSAVGRSLWRWGYGCWVSGGMKALMGSNPSQVKEDGSLARGGLTNVAGRSWEQAGVLNPPWACWRRAGPPRGRHQLHPTCCLSFWPATWEMREGKALTSSSSLSAAPQSLGPGRSSEPRQADTLQSVPSKHGSSVISPFQLPPSSVSFMLQPPQARSCGPSLSSSAL